MSKLTFEEQYKKEKYYWGLKPNKYVIDILKFKKSGTVLDLGVGEGRNAIFLAKKGFNVIGVDISKTGIKKFLEMAKNLNVKVKGVVENITKFKFERNYDVILSIATLHFLKREEIEKLIQQMKFHTTKNGLNIITVFTEDNPSKDFLYLFKKTELKSFYRDWEIIEYKEFLTSSEKHGKEGKPHKHALAILIARKR